MTDQPNDIICEKCKAVMVRVEKQPPRSFDMFPGNIDTSATSIATVITTGTRTPTTAPPDVPLYRPEPIRPIKIVKYVCSNPDCGWEFQKRE
jgi:hypothetical protein